MAKQKNVGKKEKEGKGKGNRNQRNGGGGPGNAADKIKASEAGIERKSNQRSVLESRRIQEIESGDYFARLNDGRSSNLSDLLFGVVGKYAFPGGNIPSIHLSVEMWKKSDELEIPVVVFESVQRGHEFEGKGLRLKTRLPLQFVDPSFRSKISDPAVADTQNKISACIWEMRLVAIRGEKERERLEGLKIIKQKHAERLEMVRKERNQEACRAFVAGNPGTYTFGGSTFVIEATTLHEKDGVKIAGEKNIICDGSTVIRHKWIYRDLTKYEFDPRYKHYLKIIAGVAKEELETYRKEREKAAEGRAVEKLHYQVQQKRVDNVKVETAEVTHEAKAPPDVSEAVPFTAPVFFAGNPGMFFSETDKGRAYFKHCYVVGEPALRFIFASEEHTFHEIWKRHGEITIKLSALRHEPRDAGSITEKPEAKEVLRKHLRQIAIQLGVKAPRRKQASVESIDLLSKKFPTRFADNPPQLGGQRREKREATCG